MLVTLNPLYLKDRKNKMDWWRSYSSAEANSFVCPNLAVNHLL
jgi:hypothetical protein